MAYEQSLQKISIPANTDLSAKQYYAVTVNSTGKAIVAGAGVPIVGILQNDPAAAGVGANLGFSGVSKAALGGTATAGTMAAVDSNGKFANAVSGDIAVGIFVLGGASGEIGSLLLKDIGKIW
jgi:hypothetical protein